MEAYLVLAAAAFVAGTMNAVAGGGTFVTFPALVFTGVPSVIANASNAVALFPASFASAWAYRHDFQRLENVPFKAMVAVSVVGVAKERVFISDMPDMLRLHVRGRMSEIRDLRELLAVPANYRILFMQGGGLGENAILPMNCSRGGAVDVVVTGSRGGARAKTETTYRYAAAAARRSA